MSLEDLLAEEGPYQPEDRTPSGFLGHTFDFLSRPNYASAKFFDTIAEDGLGAMGDALMGGAQEFLSPTERLSFSDLIKKYQPDFAKEHPYATTGLGFIGDVALDPTTYLSFGTTSLIKSGGRALSKKGIALLGSEMTNIAADLNKAVPMAEEGLEAGLKLIKPAKQSVRELADEKILKMIELGEEGLVDKGGLKFAGQTIISGDKFGALAGITGLTKITEKIKSMKAFEALATGFSRNFKLPEEFVDVRRGHEAFIDSLSGRSVKRVDDLMDLPEESRKKIGKLGYEIRDATRIADDTAKSLGGEVTDAQAAEIAQTMVKKAGLNVKERAAYMKSRQLQDDFMREEQAVNLLDEGIKNYQFRLYEAVKDPPAFLFYKKSGGKLSEFLGSSMEQHFKTLDDAIANGFVPEMDIAKLLAIRAYNSGKKIANKQFNDWVDVAFKDLKEAARNPANPHGIKKAKIWNRIQDDIQFMGKTNFPAGLGQAQSQFGNFYDKLLRKFKSIATVLKPSFAPKQGISNSIQIILEQGAKSQGVFNPLSIRDAATALIYDSDVVRAGTPWAEKIMQGVVTNPLNEKMSIKSLLDEFKQHRSLDNNVSVEVMKKSMGKMLKQQEFLKRHVPEGAQGLYKVITGTAKYWNLPGHVENLSALSLFINGRKLGMSPKDAIASVTRSLFDYKHALSSFETQLMRRIIPFYSFQRFAIPFVAKITAQHPGRVQNLGDAARGLFDGWNKFEGGETLTPDERRAVPGYMLEQPHVFAGMDDKMQAAFRTFNNFSPLESFGMIENDEKGDISFQRSMYKMVLAQMSPMLKVPMELMLDKNFFTDRAIQKAKNAHAGKIGKIDPNYILGATAQTLSASGGVDGMTDENQLADYLKKIMSWEVDAKGNVYVNPTMAHIATSAVPILNQVFRMANPDKSYGEKAWDLFGGVGTQKIDLKKSYAIQQERKENEAQDIHRRIRMALISGRPDEAELAQEQLKELLRIIGEERALTNIANIRGGM